MQYAFVSGVAQAGSQTLLRQRRLCFAFPTARPSTRPRAMTAHAAVKLSQDELKKQAAYKAVDYVKSGMVLGLGTGSTAAFAVDRIGDLLADGTLKDIIAVPTSIRTYEQAKGISRIDHPDITCLSHGSDVDLLGPQFKLVWVWVRVRISLYPVPLVVH
jgi:hypothetical protein